MVYPEPTISWSNTTTLSSLQFCMRVDSGGTLYTIAGIC
jgi:hypothetical protein